MFLAIWQLATIEPAGDFQPPLPAALVGHEEHTEYASCARRERCGSHRDAVFGLRSFATECGAVATSGPIYRAFERRIDLLRGQWRHSALRQSRAGSGEETELGGAFDPCVDFTAQGAEIDRLGQKGLGAALKRLALGFRIAVGSDHDDWDVRPQGLRLA
jgi:hypothetical protein